MRRMAPLIIIMLGTLSVLPVLHASQASEAPPSTDAYEAMLGYLKPVLKSSSKTGRIYFEGTCAKNGDYYEVSFPTIRAQSPLPSSTGVAAVRDIFRDVADVRVSEDPGDLIRISIGKPATKILSTKIAELNLVPIAQYNHNLALFRIEESKEVEEAQSRSGFHHDGIPLYMSTEKQPSEGAPHLHAQMTSVTWDQAIDSVTTTFPGIIFYGACAKQKFYTIFYRSLER